MTVLFPQGQRRHPDCLGWHRHPHHLHHPLHLPGCHRHPGKDGRRVVLLQQKRRYLSRTAHLVRVSTALENKSRQSRLINTYCRSSVSLARVSGRPCQHGVGFTVFLQVDRREKFAN